MNELYKIKMSNFPSRRQFKEIQQMSTQQQTDDTVSSPSTPENFKFFSIKNIFEDDSEQQIKTKERNQLVYPNKYQSYKSFTDIMASEISVIIENDNQNLQTESQLFQQFIQQYQFIINDYFQSVFSLNFNPNSLTLIFNSENFTYGPYKIQKILETTESIPMQQKNLIKKQIQTHQKTQKFLQIIGRQLPQQINFEFLYIANETFKNHQKINDHKKAQDLFYDSKIKFLNFTNTDTDISNQELKHFFLRFVQKFICLIEEIDQENNEIKDEIQSHKGFNVKNLKKFALYSSKSDYFRSEDENSAEISFMPRKKIHL